MFKMHKLNVFCSDIQMYITAFYNNWISADWIDGQSLHISILLISTFYQRGKITECAWHKAHRPITMHFNMLAVTPVNSLAPQVNNLYNNY